MTTTQQNESLAIQSSSPLTDDGVSFGEDPGLITPADGLVIPKNSTYYNNMLQQQQPSIGVPKSSNVIEFLPSAAMIASTPKHSHPIPIAGNAPTSSSTPLSLPNVTTNSIVAALANTVEDDQSVIGEDEDSTASHPLDGPVLGSGAVCGNDAKDMTSAAVALRAKEALTSIQVCMYVCM
jgi:hypothetical protein